MTLLSLRFEIAVGFVVVLLSPIIVRANTPEQIFVQVSPSVVVVDIFDATAKFVGQGSGVVIGKGQVITNCHVAQKGKSLLIRQSALTTSIDEAAPSALSLKEFLEKARPLNPGVSDGDLILPAEWIGELPKRMQTAPVKTEQTGLDLFNRAVALHQAKDWQNLLELSQQWVKSEPSSADAFWFLGMAHDGLKEYDQEIRFKRESLRIDPEDSNRWLNLAATYDLGKQYEPAAEAYRQVIRLQPENADIWGILGFLYSDRLKHD